MNPRLSPVEVRIPLDAGESNQMATTPDDAGDQLPPDLGGHLIAIGRAGMRESSLADVRSAIVNACVGFAGFDHALLCFRDPLAVALPPYTLVHSDGLSLAEAAAISVTFGDGHTGDPKPTGDVICGETSCGGQLLQVIGITADAGPDMDTSLFLIRCGDAAAGPVDVQAARLAADQVRLALRHAAAEEDLRAHAVERRLLARLTGAIVSMQDLGAVMSEVAAAVRMVSDWAGVAD